MRHKLFQLAEHLSMTWTGNDRLIMEIHNLSEYGTFEEVEHFIKIIKSWNGGWPK